MKPVTVTRDGMAALQKQLAALTKKQVMVGVPDANAERKPDPEDPHPISNAAIGFVMEFGDPELNIPARPFLVPGVAGATDAIAQRLKGAAKKLLGGDDQAVDQGLHAAGLTGQNAVRAKITNGPFAPLAPKTLAQRRARGRKGEKPLIDTGQLRQSITYVIRDKPS